MEPYDSFPSIISPSQGSDGFHIHEQIELELSTPPIAMVVEPTLQHEDHQDVELPDVELPNAKLQDQIGLELSPLIPIFSSQRNDDISGLLSQRSQQ